MSPRVPVLRTLVAALALGACSAPSSNDLTVTPSITAASLTLTVPSSCVDQATGVAQCWTYKGSFNLVLTLGDLASMPTNVSVEKLSVLLQASGEPLVSPLPQTASMPINVAIGETQIASQTFDSKLLMAPTIDKTLRDRLCNSPLVIAGSVHDSARGKSVPVTSDAFTASCP